MEMQKKSDLLSDGFVDFTKKLTRLRKIGQILKENEARKTDEEPDSVKMEVLACARCRGDSNENSTPGNPHIQDLCPADRERIAQLVEKLAECTQARHKAEAELAETRAENETLINRYDVHCNEHENEKSRLQQQLASATSRAKSLKIESSRSLDVLGDQLAVQEKEFVKLTETVRDLVREKVQLQNALIERDSRVRIAEAKLERSRDSLEMEKLLFLKEHVKDSIVRSVQHRASQTCDDSKLVETLAERKINTKTKSKNDLEEASSEGILLRTLFFKSSNPYDENVL